MQLYNTWDAQRCSQSQNKLFLSGYEQWHKGGWFPREFSLHQLTESHQDCAKLPALRSAPLPRSNPAARCRPSCLAAEAGKIKSFQESSRGDPRLPLPSPFPRAGSPHPFTPQPNCRQAEKGIYCLRGNHTSKQLHYLCSHRKTKKEHYFNNIMLRALSSEESRNQLLQARRN